MIKQLRGAALTILKRCGAFSLVKDSEWRQQKLLILCYHGVSLEDEQKWRPSLYVSPQQLERRVEIPRQKRGPGFPLAEELGPLLEEDLSPHRLGAAFYQRRDEYFQQN